MDGTSPPDPGKELREHLRMLLENAEPIDSLGRIALAPDTIREILAGLGTSDRGRTEGSALLDVAAERRRQVDREGWSAEHDDLHDDRSLALAAALYATPVPLHKVEVGASGVTWTDPWPWTKPCWAGREQAGDPMMGRVNEGDGRARHDARRRLVVAAALLLAEIERLDRAAVAADTEKGSGRPGTP